MHAGADVRELFTLMRDVARVTRLWQQDNVHCAGVTFIQFTILDHIDAAGGELPLSELHRLLSVEKSTTTRLVEPLVARGFAARAQGEDARSVRLVLTSAGREAHAEYWRCMAKSLRRAVAGVDRATYERVAEALRFFVRTVGRACEGGCG